MDRTVAKKVLHILMLEDTLTDAQLMEHELRKADIDFIAKRVDTHAAFVRALGEFHPDIVLSDYKLPAFDGLSALQIVRRGYPDVPVIMVTGALPDIEAVDLIHAGAKDYVLKDRLARLAPAVQRALSAAEEERARTSAEQALRKSLEDALQAIAATVEMRDPYTAGHQRRVADLASAIAIELGLPEDQVHGIHLAGIVHDVGKIHIPSEVLSKPGRLTEIEFSFIKTHSQAGHDILMGIDFPWPIARVVLQHHERLDGSGYPQGLKGDEIIFEARILTVADVVEAISSHRPYRPGLGVEAALSEISAKRGILYDADVVDACLKIFNERSYTL